MEDLKARMVDFMISNALSTMTNIKIKPRRMASPKIIAPIVSGGNVNPAAVRDASLTLIKVGSNNILTAIKIPTAFSPIEAIRALVLQTPIRSRMIFRIMVNVQITVK
jgi:hypothetical protein